VSDGSLFHFIRPQFLWLLAPAGLILYSMLRRQDALRAWKKLIEPELLSHLAIGENTGQNTVQKRLRPVYLLAVAWGLGILALAGPTWERESTPFSEDQAALFIVMKVTPRMLAQDVQPSRLQRAAQKVSDLLALRPGGKTGLIAYAGSAHLVMPLTSDPGVIRYFASELNPDVMPVEGDAPERALQLAQSRLQASGLPGSVVLIADSLPLPIAPEGDADVHVLAMAAGAEVVPPPGSPPAPALDESAMQQAASQLGGSLVRVTPDDSDLLQLTARIDRSIASAPAQEGERWKEAGYPLLFGLAFLVLPFFRRGGAVRLDS
jgi:Ca-activated chloride channel family protein